MKALSARLREISALLSELGQPWALAGGLAVSALTQARFTKDVDLFVAVHDDEEAEALVHRLVTAGYGIKTCIEQDAVGRLSTVRMLPPGEDENGIVVDLLFASSGIESEIISTARLHEMMPGLNVPVPTIGHLIAVKVLSQDGFRRPQDLADIKSLLEAGDESDVAEARAALKLIEERGFSRGKDLLADLDRLRSQLF